MSATQASGGEAADVGPKNSGGEQGYPGYLYNTGIATTPKEFRVCAQ